MIQNLPEYIYTSVIPCITAVVAIISSVLVGIKKIKDSIGKQECLRAKELVESKDTRKDVSEIIKLNKALLVENAELKKYLIQLIEQTSKVKGVTKNDSNKKV